MNMEKQRLFSYWKRNNAYLNKDDGLINSLTACTSFILLSIKNSALT